jgi:8-oxo-dGTP diphosphatase
MYARGIVTNEYNDILLILRSDSRTWAPPGGGLETGESPPVAAAREIEEETGVKVLPVRLVGLQFRPEKPNGMLMFTFRCLVRGGQPTPSSESIRVGFFPTNDLPRPMLSVHRVMIEHGLHHSGGPPDWHTRALPPAVRLGRRLMFRYYDLRRWLERRPPFQWPPAWPVGAFVVIRNPAGEVLWIKRTDYDIWNLPGGGYDGLEAPWETAQREALEETGLQVRLTDLTGVYLKPEQNQMNFTFTAEVIGGTLTTGPEAADFAYFAPGREPANALPKHVERVADAVAPAETTRFREQSGPSGSTILDRP